MTRKINFRQIAIMNVEGKEQRVDISQLLGNQLYMEGANIEECELGKRIYFAKEEVELTDAESEILRVFTQRYSYVIRNAIADMLKSQTTD